jgi:hypothetical protein
MKKVIRLNERELTQIVRKILKEQNDSEGDSTECLKQYIDFLFEPTDFDKDGYPVDGGDLGLWNNNKIPNLNDDKAYNRFIKHLEYCHNDVGIYDDDDACENITLEDMIPLAKNLYRNHIKEIINQAQKQAIQTARQMFAGNESEDKLVDIIVRLSKKYNIEIPLNIKRKLSEPTFIKFINDAIQETPPQQYASLRPDKDEFDYADYILQVVIVENYNDFVNLWTNTDAYDEFYDYIRDNFGDRILEAWIDEIGFND